VFSKYSRSRVCSRLSLRAGRSVLRPYDTSERGTNLRLRHGSRCHDGQVNIRVLVGGLLVMLDLAVVFLVGAQVASKSPVNSGILLPTLGLNVFGMIILWVAKRDD
jgi:hypothetical protein